MGQWDRHGILMQSKRTAVEREVSPSQMVTWQLKSGIRAELGMKTKMSAEEASSKIE